MVNGEKKQSVEVERRHNMVKTLKEWDERVRAAMKPPQANQGGGFSPGIQQIRQAARNRQPRRLNRLNMAS